MPLPEDASIEEVAKVFGVANRVKELTPAARRLTKGQMLALLGAEKEVTVITMVALGSFKRPPAATVQRNARIAKIRLNTADIQSVQRVFGPARLPASERQ